MSHCYPKDYRYLQIKFWRNWATKPTIRIWDFMWKTIYGHLPSMGGLVMPEGRFVPMAQVERILDQQRWEQMKVQVDPTACGMDMSCEQWPKKNLVMNAGFWGDQKLTPVLWGLSWLSHEIRIPTYQFRMTHGMSTGWRGTHFSLAVWRPKKTASDVKQKSCQGPNKKCRDGVVKISHESSFDHNQQHLPNGAVRNLRDVV